MVIITTKDYLKSRIVREGYQLIEIPKNKKAIQQYAAINSKKVIVGCLSAIYDAIRNNETDRTVTIYTNTVCSILEKK